MLAKTDLVHVRKVIREEIETEAENLGNTIQTELKLFRMELSVRIEKIENRLKELEVKARKISEDTAKVKSDSAKIKKDLNSILGYSDEMHIKLRNRVNKIENTSIFPRSVFK